MLQHGFGGDNTFVTQVAADFTEAGLAAIGIPAPEHGPRGASFLDFFVFDDFSCSGRASISTATAEASCAATNRAISACPWAA